VASSSDDRVRRPRERALTEALARFPRTGTRLPIGLFIGILAAILITACFACCAGLLLATHVVHASPDRVTPAGVRGVPVRVGRA
jgi:hypothetical protein